MTRFAEATAVAATPPAPPSRPRGTVRMVLAMVVALGVLLVPAGASAATATYTATGIVRDDAGAPVADLPVVLSLDRDPSPSRYDREEHRARTDADGRYLLAGVTRNPEPSGDLSVEETPAYASARADDLGSRLRALRGDTLVTDLVVRRRDAVLSGRISVRDGAMPDGGRVTVQGAGATEDRGWFDTEADSDGRWRIAVPAGTYRTRAASRAGLGAWAPDLPAARVTSPSVSVGHGETRTGVDLSLRRRSPGPAYDEYGTLQGGSDPTLAGITPGTYPIDPHRPAATRIGPRVSVETTSVLLGGGPLDVRVVITNTGDDDVFTGPIRLEGPDRFTCWGTWGGACEPRMAGVVGSLPVQFVLAPRMVGDQRDYRTTVVVPTNTPSGTLRIPVHVRDTTPTPAELAAAEEARKQRADAFIAAFAPQAAHGTVPRPGAGGDVGRVSMTRSRLRVTFPAAGTATSVIDRSVTRKVRGKTRRRWRTVRRLTVRSTGATTLGAKVRRLAKGRYRVRTRYAIGTRAPRTTTTFWTIRR